MENHRSEQNSERKYDYIAQTEIEVITCANTWL